MYARLYTDSAVFFGNSYFNPPQRRAITATVAATMLEPRGRDRGPEESDLGQLEDTRPISGG